MTMPEVAHSPRSADTRRHPVPHLHLVETPPDSVIEHRIEHELQPVVPPVEPRGRRVLWLVIGGSSAVGMPALFAAGWALGHSELGAAIATAVVTVIIAAALVLFLLAERGVVHCPGCPR